MQRVYLTRRNLLTLLSKLDRKAKGEETACELQKFDTTHLKFPCSDVISVVALEDSDYYTDRMPGRVLAKDEPKG